MKTATLDSRRVVETVTTLQSRIAERFPDSSILNTAKLLQKNGTESEHQIEKIRKPLVLVRLVICMLILLIIAGIAGTVINLKMPAGFNFFDFVQVLEAGINDIVLIGAGIFFLVTAETRIKRTRALRAIHELRSIAHVIDMLQLTKDPTCYIYPGRETVTSPVRKMSVFELCRYLDYCSELLSLTGKLAALYAQDFNDPIALSAVNEVESLTTGLSRKIWQKLMIIHENKGVSGTEF